MLHTINTRPLAHRLAVRADHLVSLAAFAAAVQVVATRRGVCPDKLRQGLTAEQTAKVALYARGLSKSDERDLAAARQEALYLAVTHFNRGHRSIARVAGVSHKTVERACAAVENRRDDRAFDRDIDELELALMGSAA